MKLVGLNRDQILQIVKSKGKFECHKYSYRDVNLRKKLRIMVREKILVCEGTVNDKLIFKLRGTNDDSSTGI